MRIYGVEHAAPYIDHTYHATKRDAIAYAKQHGGTVIAYTVDPALTRRALLLAGLYGSGWMVDSEQVAGPFPAPGKGE